MAISAYIGIPGSGKSYEAVCNVIIPAFTSGRRVVTNIYGLQKDKITERYPDATGEIIVVDNDDVLKADFFPFKGGEGSFCQFGDLIVIDEAWRIFGSDKDMTAEKKSFIAEHRHFTHPETGISCDLVIVNQSLSNIARFLKDKIETTYQLLRGFIMSVKNKARDRLPGGRLKSYRRVGSHFASCARWFDKSPSWYRNMMMTRPERREVRSLLNQVMRGHDADGIAFPVSHRPFVYWW